MLRPLLSADESGKRNFPAAPAAELVFCGTSLLIASTASLPGVVIFGYFFYLRPCFQSYRLLLSNMTLHTLAIRLNFLNRFVGLIWETSWSARRCLGDKGWYPSLCSPVVPLITFFYLAVGGIRTRDVLNMGRPKAVPRSRPPAGIRCVVNVVNHGPAFGTFFTVLRELRPS